MVPELVAIAFLDPQLTFSSAVTEFLSNMDAKSRHNGHCPLLQDFNASYEFRLYVFKVGDWCVVTAGTITQPLVLWRKNK